jgi:hypothetical protein
MRTTLHRPKPGDATPHDLDFLAGIDLEAEHRRPRPDKRTIVYAAIAAFLLLAAIVVAILVTGDATTVPDGSLGTTSMERDFAPAVRPAATDVIVLDLAGLDAVAAPSAAPAAKTFSRPAATDLIVPDLSGLDAVAAPSAAPAVKAFSRPAATDLIVPDLSGLDPGSPANLPRTWEPDALLPQ